MKIGDRIQTNTGGGESVSGTIIAVDDSDVELPYKIRLDDGSVFWSHGSSVLKVRHQKVWVVLIDDSGQYCAVEVCTTREAAERSVREQLDMIIKKHDDKTALIEQNIFASDLYMILSERPSLEFTCGKINEVYLNEA